MSPRLGKVLVLLLMLSNIGVGLFGFYSLRAVDEKYSMLLLRVVPTLNDLQTLSTEATAAMHLTNPIVLKPSTQNEEPAKSARLAIEHDARQRSVLLGRYWLPSDSEQRVNFESAGANFTRAANDFLDLAKDLPEPEASHRRERMLRPAFAHYLAAITQATTALEADGIEASDALTLKTGHLSKILIAVGSWPAAVLLMILFASLFIFLFFVRSGVFRTD